MKKLAILFIILSVMTYGAFSFSLPVTGGYSNALLTNDYGILNKYFIEHYVPGLKTRPFTTQTPSGAYIYWQCFPREHIVVTLEDTGFSSDDFGWGNNIADLKIRVTIKQNIFHQYNARKRMTVTEFEKIFNKWQNIMKGEKYVCLAGSFMFREHKIEYGKEREEYQWIFEALKTEKGCDSDLYSCSVK